MRPFIEPALRALQWLEQYGDPDGDGFYEYQTRSPMGPRNQAWKDSPDAIVYEDGGLVDPPIATCEEQGFVYVAKLHLAEMLCFLGERDLSRKLYHEAARAEEALQRGVLDGRRGLLRARARREEAARSARSRRIAGHCIAVGDRRRLARRAHGRSSLRSPICSAAGASARSPPSIPRYNPYSYHLGSIWPVEHGTFALGFMRYGLHDRVEQIARAQFEAASLFEYHRLPELFGGHPRDEQHPFPAIYPNANSPQAWSASSVFSLLQAMLGLYPYAPLKMLIVDPHLPEWLPEITLRDLRVGKARVTIRFRRRSGRPHVVSHSRSARKAARRAPGHAVVAHHAARRAAARCAQQPAPGEVNVMKDSRVVVITGASAGIGRATARAFAVQKFHVS